MAQFHKYLLNWTLRVINIYWIEPQGTFPILHCEARIYVQWIERKTSTVIKHQPQNTERWEQTSILLTKSKLIPSVTLIQSREDKEQILSSIYSCFKHLVPQVDTICSLSLPKGPLMGKWRHYLKPLFNK